MKTLTTAKLHTPDLRLAIVNWRSELLSLANEFPDLYPAEDLDRRIADLDNALLAIDTSVLVSLVPLG